MCVCVCVSFDRCAKILLTSGIEAVAASDGEGRTPLFLSLQHGHNECASVLLEAGEEAVLSSVTKVCGRRERDERVKGG